MITVQFKEYKKGLKANFTNIKKKSIEKTHADCEARRWGGYNTRDSNTQVH